MYNLTLKSAEDVEFLVDAEIAKISMTIGTMLESLGEDENEGAVIPLTKVRSKILEKVIQWATYHKNDPPPVEDEKYEEPRTDDIIPWDAEFLRVDQSTLFELMLAANYLDIKGLLDLTCKTTANMIKGKTPEAIRTLFNIENDFDIPGAN